MMPDLTQQGVPQEPTLPSVAETIQPTAPALLLENASKWYGEVAGLNDVSISISGGVTGLLGMNGAGKSTLLKLVVGKLKPSQGTVRLFGTNPWRDTSPYSRVGYCPESEQMYDWMTGLDFVSTLARLHGYSRAEARERALHTLDFMGLTDVAHKVLGKYSKGMRQRVKIAHALVNDPDLIILDEPLAGCDPLARTTIMNVVRELGAMGKTIIVSSHILHEIERITEQIVLLHNGRLLALGNLHAIRKLLDQHPHRISLKTDEPRRLAKSFLEHPSISGVHFPDAEHLLIETGNLGEVHAQLPQMIIDSGILVKGIDNPDDNLETILSYLMEGRR